MGQGEHQADLCGAGIDAEILGDTDKTGIVASGIHQRPVGGEILHLRKTIDPCASLGGNGGHVATAGGNEIRDGAGGLSGVATDHGAHVGMGLQESTALAKPLIMRIDDLDIAHTCAGGGEQAMVDAKLDAADDRKVIALHEVVDLVNSAVGAVLNRQDAVVAISALHGGEHVPEGAEIADTRQGEQTVGRHLAVCALHTLAGDHAAVREQGRGLLHGASDARRDGLGMILGVRLGQKRRLAGLGKVHHDREKGLGVVAVILTGKIGHIGQDLPLAGAVVHGQSALALICRHVGGNVHATAEFLYQLAIQRVDLRAAIFYISCHICSYAVGRTAKGI